MASDTLVHQYPSEIVSLKLESQFDNAKWRLYCMHCDDTLQFTPFSGVANSGVTYGNLKLEFDHLEIRKNLIEIDFFSIIKIRELMVS